VGSGLADEAGHSHSVHRLQPAEDLLDPLPLSLADLVALGAGRSSVEPRRLASVDPGNVRTDVAIPQVLDEVLHVVVLVGIKGFEMNLPAPGASEQLAGSFAFGLGASMMSRSTHRLPEFGIRPRNRGTSRTEDRLRRASLLCLGFEDTARTGGHLEKPLISPKSLL